MTTTTFEVVNGRVVPDVDALDLAGAVRRKAEIQGLLSALKGDPTRADERRALIAEDAWVVLRIRELREAEKVQNTRRNFAGIGSPFYEAVAARLDVTLVAELEADAMARFAERERRAAERKASKA